MSPAIDSRPLLTSESTTNVYRLIGNSLQRQQAVDALKTRRMLAEIIDQGGDMTVVRLGKQECRKQVQIIVGDKIKLQADFTGENRPRFTTKEASSEMHAPAA